MNNKIFSILIGLYFVFYSLYWLVLVTSAFENPLVISFIDKFSDFHFETQYSNFTHTYSVICLLGVFIGVNAGTLWGGLRSTFGKSLLLFSAGLLFQHLGQATIAYYELWLDIHNPYPSYAEIFFVGSIPFYISAAYYLGKSYGIEGYLNFKNKNFIYVLILGGLLTVISYMKFVQSTEITYSELMSFFEENSIDYIFLEIIYPIGQSIFIALVILDLLLLRNIKKSHVYEGVMIFLIALVLQFGADTIYLYYDEIFSDILYICSYSLLTIGLLYFNRIPSFSQNNGKN